MFVHTHFFPSVVDNCLIILYLHIFSEISRPIKNSIMVKKICKKHDSIRSLGLGHVLIRIAVLLLYVDLLDLPAKCFIGCRSTLAVDVKEDGALWKVEQNQSNSKLIKIRKIFQCQQDI